MESSAAKQQPMAGVRMITAEKTYLRSELEQRRDAFTRFAFAHCRCFLFATADSCGYGAEPHPIRGHSAL